MQVSECFWRGQLREMVHNLTLELDLEMVVSILKDVAAALAYLQQIDLGIAHQPLSSAKVPSLPYLLRYCNADNCAQLVCVCVCVR